MKQQRLLKRMENLIPRKKNQMNLRNIKLLLKLNRLKQNPKEKKQKPKPKIQLRKKKKL